MAARGGKVAVYVPPELAEALAAWEQDNGKVNLSALVQETIRRTIGQLHPEDRQRDQLAGVLRDVRRLTERVKRLERAARAGS